jgi:hypothetical protein
MEHWRDYVNKPITVNWPAVGALPSRGTLVYLGDSYLVLRDADNRNIFDVIPIPAIAHVEPN